MNINRGVFYFKCIKLTLNFTCFWAFQICKLTQGSFDVTTVGGDGTFIYHELLKQQPAHALQPGLQVIQIG